MAKKLVVKRESLALQVKALINGGIAIHATVNPIETVDNKTVINRAGLYRVGRLADKITEVSLADSVTGNIKATMTLRGNVWQVQPTGENQKKITFEASKTSKPNRKGKNGEIIINLDPDLGVWLADIAGKTIKHLYPNLLSTAVRGSSPRNAQIKAELESEREKSENLARELEKLQAMVKILSEKSTAE